MNDDTMMVEPPTDKEKLTALFIEFGIGFLASDGMINERYIIDCEQGNAKIDGYLGFFTAFHFDKDGKFIEMGAWE